MQTDGDRNNYDVEDDDDQPMRISPGSSVLSVLLRDEGGGNKSRNLGLSEVVVPHT